MLSFEREERQINLMILYWREELAKSSEMAYVTLNMQNAKCFNTGKTKLKFFITEWITINVCPNNRRKTKGYYIYYSSSIGGKVGNQQ